MVAQPNWLSARLSVDPVEAIGGMRRRCVEGAGGGAGRAARERPSGAARALDGSLQEAHLVALACTAPPPGRKRWTMQLLADKLVACGVAAPVSDETVRRALKGAVKPWQRKQWRAADGGRGATWRRGWRMCSTCTRSRG